jgi:hypothetical protein
MPPLKATGIFGRRVANLTLQRLRRRRAVIRPVGWIDRRRQPIGLASTDGDGFLLRSEPIRLGFDNLPLAPATSIVARVLFSMITMVGDCERIHDDNRPVLQLPL